MVTCMGEDMDREADKQIREETAGPDGGQWRYMRNNKYLTICIYAFSLVVVSTIAIRLIVQFKETKSFFASLTTALSPFFIALLTAYLLTPFVRVVDRLLHRIKKNIRQSTAKVLSLLIVYLVFLGLVIAILVYILPAVLQNLVDLVSRIPDLYENVQDLMGYLEKRFPNANFTQVENVIGSTQSELTKVIQEFTDRVIPIVYSASVNFVRGIINVVIALVVSVYMLHGKKDLLRIVKIVVYAFTPTAYIADVKQTLLDCNRIFSSFLISKMIDSLIIGMLCAVLMSVLHLPYVFLVSIMIGVTNMIPYFGPFIGAIPGIMIMLVISPVKALIFAIMILCLQQFDGLYLGPKLMGSSTGMKPFWVILAITIGGYLFGVVGMFLGVPIMAILGYLIEKHLSAKLERKGMKISEIR